MRWQNPYFRGIGNLRVQSLKMGMGSMRKKMYNEGNFVFRSLAFAFYYDLFKGLIERTTFLSALFITIGAALSAVSYLLSGEILNYFSVLALCLSIYSVFLLWNLSYAHCMYHRIGTGDGRLYFTFNMRYRRWPYIMLIAISLFCYDFVWKLLGLENIYIIMLKTTFGVNVVTSMYFLAFFKYLKENKAVSKKSIISLDFQFVAVGVIALVAKLVLIDSPLSTTHKIPVEIITSLMLAWAFSSRMVKLTLDLMIETTKTDNVFIEKYRIMPEPEAEELEMRVKSSLPKLEFQ